MHCFVDRGGLDTLVNVGEDADHNYIIYIIRGEYTVQVHNKSFILVLTKLYIMRINNT